MKRIYLLLLILFSLGITTQGANLQRDNSKKHAKYEKSCKHEKKGRYRTYNKAERIDEIDFKLDILKAKYKRDENKVKNSNADKYDKDIKKKELKYQYKKEEKRLKDEKNAIKKGS